MTTPETLYVRLQRAANTATGDAMRWRREPNTTALAALRLRDAQVLRQMAREALRL